MQEQVAELSFQDQWADRTGTCWGCGSRNEHGLRIRSFWSGDESVCVWMPKPYHATVPGVLSGGIIASLIDCHCACTAIAAVYKAEGRAIGSEPFIWYVTSSLQVFYLRLTPTSVPVVLRARVKEAVGRKTVLTCSLFSDGDTCAKGEVVTVRVPRLPGAGPGRPATQ